LKIEKKLAEYANMRKLHRESRIKKWLPTVWIVWYTNTGKSSLLNSLTRKWALAENKLFATLWTNVGLLYIITDPVTWRGYSPAQRGKEILLNDTIGFIRDLPPKLIKAFSSTLEDSIESNLLLHVIDASDPFVEERIDIVNHILDEIWAKQKRILVFNKIDLASPATLKKLKKEFWTKDTVRTSFKDMLGLDDVKKIIIKNL
jgi:GTP-binding protein HflX